MQYAHSTQYLCTFTEQILSGSGRLNKDKSYYLCNNYGKYFAYMFKLTYICVEDTQKITIYDNAKAYGSNNSKVPDTLFT